MSKRYTTTAVIGARLNSSRLPGKHLKMLEGKSLIQRLVHRLEQSSLVDTIVLATTADKFNLALIDHAKNISSLNTFVYNKDIDDLVGRVDEAFKAYPADYLVYICGDCPMIEPGLIDHALRSLHDNPERDSIKLNSTKKSLHEGMAFYSKKGWNKLLAASLTPSEREHLGIADKTKRVLDKLTIEDVNDFSLIQHRISVDTAADLAFMQEVYSRWYREQNTDSIVDLSWLQSELLRDRSLRKINSHVVQKKTDISYAKAALFTHASSKIGLGHLRRCSSVANTLQETLGIGAHLHIVGEARDLYWLTANVSWYKNFESLSEEMKINDNPYWLLDFHPDYIDIQKLVSTCKDVKTSKQIKMVAMDKLSALLQVADSLFIPSFYTELQPNEKYFNKISYGWDNYFLPPPLKSDKKKQIIVLTGGADALEYGVFLPELIERSVPRDWPLLWIQGPYAPAPKIKSPARWQLHKSPNNLQKLLSESEVCISSYGLSLFEAMSMGCLTVLLPVKHLCTEKELVELEASRSCVIARSPDQLASYLRELSLTKKEPHELIKNATSLLAKAKGAELVCKHFQSI